MNYSVTTHTRTAGGSTMQSALDLSAYYAELRRAQRYGATVHHWHGDDRSGKPMHVAWVANGPGFLDTQVWEIQPAGAELRMGALLREALAFQGISVRVDKPWDSLPTEYLVAEREGYTRVWIHAHSCNGAMHYDIPRAELLGVAAVITDHASTRFVYDGFSDESARPVAQAAAMAAAVARHFEMPVRETPDPFTDATMEG